MDQVTKHINKRFLNLVNSQNRDKIPYQKHITTNMIKEFTPLMGYISWSSFQCRASFIKCSNLCFHGFTMFIMQKTMSPIDPKL